MALSKDDTQEDEEGFKGLDLTDDDTADGAVNALFVALPILLILGAYGMLTENSNGLSVVETVKSINFSELISSTADKVEEMGPLGYAYFSAIYITAEILALPAIPLTASAGYLFGALPGTATVLFSATIAAGVSFLIGRTFLRRYIQNLTKDNPTFQAIDAAVGKEGFKIVLLLRLSPLLPFALSNYFYGLTAVEFWPYLLATLLGFAPGTFAYVYTGEAAKAISGQGEAGGAELPLYAYAGAALALAGISKIITDIASEALKDIEEPIQPEPVSSPNASRVPFFRAKRDDEYDGSV